MFLFKALFIGYLFGIRSERVLTREIEVNVAYHWFLKLGLTELPDASTISQNRRRRFNGTVIHQQLCDEIVLQAVNAGFVDGLVIYTNSTLLKASVNEHKFDLAMVAKPRAAYWDDPRRSPQSHPCARSH
jgi:transposase